VRRCAKEIARAHDVSRHTVRAALAALGAERLVQLVPYAGARVSALDDDDLRALQQLRAALETEAVRLITEAQGVAWSAATRAAIEAAIGDLADAEARADWTATIRAHAAVHRAIVDAADSPRLAEAHAGLESEVLLLLTHVRPHYAPGALAAEHRAYLDALPRDGERPFARISTTRRSSSAPRADRHARTSPQKVTNPHDFAASVRSSCDSAEFVRRALTLSRRNARGTPAFADAAARRTRMPRRLPPR
jgi:DNA-binding GntR family transcriptional regulator